MKRSWFFVGVGAVTAATLILELSLTRVFSVIMYHHFTFLAVSLALFGLGLAGVVVYLRPALGGPDGLARALGRYPLYAAAATVLALSIILRQRVSADVNWQNLGTVSVIYVVAATPFFAAGVIVTLAVSHLRREIGTLYFVDLLGAACGCLAVVPLLGLFGGSGTVLCAAGLFASAALAFSLAFGVGAHKWRLGLGLGALGLSVVLIVGAAQAWFFRMPSAKETREERVVFEGWNAFSRVTVEKTPHDFMWLRIDSSAATKIFSGALADQGWQPTRRFSENRVASLAYALAPEGAALIIGPGGGGDVISALMHGRRRVLAVEVNPLIAEDVMADAFREYSGGLYQRPEVELHVGDGRAFVRATTEHYQSIQATLVDTWAAAAAGAFTLSENNLYTRQAFGDYLTHLAPTGVLTMTRWRAPPKEFLRLLVLGRAALDDLGVAAHAAHFYVAADLRLATFVLGREPLTPAAIAAFDRYVADAGLATLYAPGRAADNPVARFLSAPDWRAFVAAFREDISPPTDDRPFFFYTTKPSELLTSTRAGLGHGGLSLLLMPLALVIVLVLAFLLLPLFWLRRDVTRSDRRGKAGYLLYFVAIGVGFITFEMAMMQTFVRALGQPVLSLVAVLFALLVAGGLGSYCSRPRVLGRFGLSGARVQLLPRVLVLLIVPLLAPLVADLVASYPVTVRVVAVVLFVAPVGFVLGAFLPLGILAAGARFQAVVPWAWGVNGAASVLGSVLAVAIAMNVGFVDTMLVGVCCYALAWALAPTAVEPAVSASS
ncbi:MAG: hypothetical protein HY903_04210 [Deltaproteobacteria bacterium]|nr:hypothetical protein [Deltaproteobacteria bacterium]